MTKTNKYGFKCTAADKHEFLAVERNDTRLSRFLAALCIPPTALPPFLILVPLHWFEKCWPSSKSKIFRSIKQTTKKVKTIRSHNKCIL